MLLSELLRLNNSLNEFLNLASLNAYVIGLTIEFKGIILFVTIKITRTVVFFMRPGAARLSTYVKSAGA